MVQTRRARKSAIVKALEWDEVRFFSSAGGTGDLARGIHARFWRASDVGADILDWALRLMTKTIAPIYRSLPEWDWDPQSKTTELCATDVRWLVVYGVEGLLPIAFAAFSFEFADDGDTPIAYLLELHCEPEHQRKGIGSWMMQRIRQAASAACCQKIVLTVFNANISAFEFYQRQPGWAEDDTSPDSDENQPYKIFAISI